MRLLVTRPEPGAGATAAMLEKLGHAVHRHPLTRIVFDPEPEIAVDPGAIAVTSRNGVRALTGWRRASDWKDLPVFAVGRATAAAAAEAGFTDIRRADGDVTALAGLIAGTWNAASGPLVYPAARERAADLGALLEGSGIAAETVMAYHTEDVAGSAEAVRGLLAGGAIDGVLATSRRSASALAEAAGADGLAKVTVYALSEQAAGPLAGLAGAVRIAERPDMESLLALLGDRPKP